MSLTLLRVALLIETLVAAAAAVTGIRLIGWRNVPPNEFLGSPDAVYIVEGLLQKWGFLSGCCVGMAICLGIIAIAQRKNIAASNVLLKMHWLAVALPPTAILWIAKDLW